MKLKAYITAMFLSVVFLLIMPFVPHHHHEGAICTDADICIEDVCDGVLHEHDEDHAPLQTSNCAEQSDYLVERPVDISPSSTLLNALSFLPVHLLQLVDFLIEESHDAPYVARDEAPVTACFIHSLTLRAPPCAC